MEKIVREESQLSKICQTTKTYQKNDITYVTLPTHAAQHSVYYIQKRLIMDKTYHDDKSWKNQNFHTFSIRLLIGKKPPPKPRACRKQEISIFQSFFN